MGHRTGCGLRNMVSQTLYDAAYVPARGDVVQINLEPQVGTEIRKRRPALVLSSWDFNIQQKAAVICPITRTVRGTDFEVPVPEGLAVEGVIRADQVKCLDWRERNARFLTYLPEGTVTAVSNRIEAIIWGE